MYSFNVLINTLYKNVHIYKIYSHKRIGHMCDTYLIRCYKYTNQSHEIYFKVCIVVVTQLQYLGNNAATLLCYTQDFLEAPTGFILFFIYKSQKKMLNLGWLLVFKWCRLSYRDVNDIWTTLKPLRLQSLFAIRKYKDNENTSFFFWKEQPTKSHFKLFFSSSRITRWFSVCRLCFVTWIGYHLPSQFDSFCAVLLFYLLKSYTV